MSRATPKTTWLAIVAGALLCAAGLLRLEPELDMVQLLPDVEDREQVVAVLEAFGSTPHAILHLQLRPEADTEDLLAAVELLAEALIAEPEVGQLMAGIDPSGLAGLQQDLSSWAGLLADPASPDWRQPEALDRSMRELARGLLLPLSPEQRAALLTDPYGWDRELLSQLGSRRGDSSGVELHEGRLLSRDRSAALIAARPSGAGGPPFIELLDSLAHGTLDSLGTVDVSLVGPGALAVDGERSVRRDMKQPLTASGTVILILLLVSFRRLHAPAWLGLPAVLAAAASAGIAGWLGLPLHGLALAFAAALLGLCVDFPLHLLVQAREEASSGASPPEAWRRARSALARPAAACAITSSGGFALLGFSGSPILRQLAWIGVPALLLAALLGVGGLSRLAEAAGWHPGLARSRRESSSSRAGSSASGAWLAALLVSTLALGLPQLQLEGDPRSFQRQSPEMQVRVADFEEDFGGSSVPILLALHGPSVGESLETTRKATVALRDLGEDGPSRLSALTDLVPPSSVLTARCLELREIDRRSWRAEASEVAARHGLTGQALEPFFERLEVLAGLCDGGRQVEGARLAGPFAALWDRHVRELDSGAMSIVFVFTRERLEQVPQGWLEAVGGAGAEATWVFFNELSRAATDAMLSDVVLLGLAGLFLALALLRLLLGSVRAAGIVLITPLLALIGTVGLLGWLTPIQGPLPVVGLGSLLLVLGLGVDDGVYVVDALQEGRSLAPVRRAIGLTTLTSVIGFGALALAETPALRALGQVAVAGLILDLVVALYLVPRIWARRSAK